MSFCGYDVHPAANLFPMMTDEEFDELSDDIREHGQILPIILYDNKILDGRNRAMACHRLGKTPKTEILVCDDPISWAISANAKRRNLSKSQLSAVAAESLSLYEAEAKERQGTRTDIKEKIPESSKGQARDKAAAATGVNPRYVSDAKKIKEESPETFEKLKSGEVTLSEAKAMVRPIPKTEFTPNEQKKIDEAEKDSEGLWNLKDAWRRAKKTERKQFLQWAKES